MQTADFFAIEIKEFSTTCYNFKMGQNFCHRNGSTIFYKDQ